MMQKIVGVTELQRRFRAIFDEVVQNNTPYILTRGSRPEAVLIPYEEFLRFQVLQEQDMLANFDRLTSRMAKQQAAIDEAELQTDIETARTEITG